MPSPWVVLLRLLFGQSPRVAYQLVKSLMHLGKAPRPLRTLTPQVTRATHHPRPRGSGSALSHSLHQGETKSRIRVHKGFKKLGLGCLTKGLK